MLILSRKIDQRIMIGDNITITVCEMRDGKVRLGIDAPKDITVHREEVDDKIRNLRAEWRGKK